MVRGRMKHKEVVETLHHTDWEIFQANVTQFWNNNIKPYEKVLLTGITAVLVVGIGFLWFTDKKANDLVEANEYLSEAKRRYDEGDMAGALSELDYIEDSRVSIPSELINANIAYASGEYEQAISILGRLTENAPDSIRTDILYQYATAQESNGDYEGALQSLEKIKTRLGEEPDTSDPSRDPSLWDRYYYHQGRVLSRMGKRDEAIKELLKITERSAWSVSARNEINWIKAIPVGALTNKWVANGS